MRKRNGNGIRITENLKQGQQRHWCWRGKEWSPDPALVPFILMKHAERQSLCQQSAHSRTAKRKYWKDLKYLSTASWGILK